MRIYNGKNSQVDMPLATGQRVTIAPKSISGDIMPNNDFLSLLVTSYDYSEIALVVSGPFEINMCSQVSCCAGFVVNTLEEAIERFAKLDADKANKSAAVNKANMKEEVPVVDSSAAAPIEPVKEESEVLGTEELGDDAPTITSPEKAPKAKTERKKK